MIVVNGDFEKVKEEMKEVRKLKTTTPLAIHKRYENQYSRLERELKRNELLSHMYSVSKVLPVKIDDHIFNYKVYTSFIKKLNGYQIKTEVIDDSLYVYYTKGKKSNGLLALRDLSPYFEGFIHIPEGHIADVS